MLAPDKLAAVVAAIVGAAVADVEDTALALVAAIVAAGLEPPDAGAVPAGAAGMVWILPLPRSALSLSSSADTLAGTTAALSGKGGKTPLPPKLPGLFSPTALCLRRPSPPQLVNRIPL